LTLTEIPRLAVCVAAFCGVLQHVAACFGVLQRVAGVAGVAV